MSSRRDIASTTGSFAPRWSPSRNPRIPKLEVEGMIPISALRLFARYDIQRKDHGKDHWNRSRDDQLLRGDHGGWKAQSDRELRGRAHYAFDRRVHGGR